MALYPWQTATYQALSNAFLNGRGHHALLFKTELGLGTDTLVRHFAHWLLCQHPQGNLACGQCKSCLLTQAENHPDFHLIHPLDGKDIGIDQIREMTARLQQFAQQGGNTVVYIQDADRLTEAAANALLKTLEEPPQQCYFLLEAPLSAPILATIQSRCQTWLIHTPEHQIAYDWLQSHCPNTEPQSIDVSLRLCRHRPLICKDFLETDRLTQRKTFFQTFWRFYKSRDVWFMLKAFSTDIPQLLTELEWLESFFSDAVKAKLAITNGWLNLDLEKGVQLFSQQLSTRQLLAGHQILQQTQQDLREINAVNAELIVMDCLTKLVLRVFEGCLPA
ncbi:DNA polymerase III subunit delta' [Muribacter muris]|uniref:DNA polymerase III subunit delta' n=1 Tax=Muribacter muris TaxID=67855 RepID=A0A4Y9JWV5_9PAST|nr:DNA polymerase III subunit delta' [Muribacter muris]MBF0785063.1 DNA polymerase III subunit delta' [Muribacter muris]MBF0826722.1 DNA polymerase III subunit delta' [Muribacter muris]TFV10303.1 DNA polymerase III subunit delta' [Muribacter muris]